MGVSNRLDPVRKEPLTHTCLTKAGVKLLVLGACNGLVTMENCGLGSGHYPSLNKSRCKKFKGERIRNLNLPWL